MYKRLLTIQDISCVGQCSLTVALPIISACGIETSILPSAVLSTHTGGFKNFTFCDLTDEISNIERGWNKDGLKFNAFYTGYVCPKQIAPILSVMSSTAAAGALRFVDPVMADNGKLYPGFGHEFPAQMARLVKDADYVLPNLTEAALLLGREPVLEGYDRAFVEEIIEGLLKLGAKNVVLTGVSFEPNLLGSAVSTSHGIEYDFNERLTRFAHGTGDVFASVFVGAIMRGWTSLDAAALAADVVCEAIRVTPVEHWYGVAFERAIPFLVNKLG